jgi:hypothetical protein
MPYGMLMPGAATQIRKSQICFFMFFYAIHNQWLNWNCAAVSAIVYVWDKRSTRICLLCRRCCPGRHKALYYIIPCRILEPFDGPCASLHGDDYGMAYGSHVHTKQAQYSQYSTQSQGNTSHKHPQASNNM